MIPAGELADKIVLKPRLGIQINPAKPDQP
jgi:hypothetical protein